MKTRKIFTFFSVFLCFSFCLFASQDFKIEEQPLALKEASFLCNEGILKQKKNGYVYLDVTNEFVSHVGKFIQLTEGQLYLKPVKPKSIGAHIGVFHEKENVSPEELGKKFAFQVQDIRSFYVHTRDGLKKLWAFTVQCPELESLREKYGLNPKLSGHEFHITVGKQMPKVDPDWRNITVLSPLNFSHDTTLDLETVGDFKRVEDTLILKKLENLQGIGQLCMKSNGFVYLDVDNQFVENIASFLPIEGSFRPVSTSPKSIGVHMSVIYENEMIKNQIWTLKEAGQWFTFKVKQVRFVNLNTRSGHKKLWLLAIEAPALQRLRTQYGLKPKLQGYDFHITIGYEKTEEKEKRTAA